MKPRETLAAFDEFLFNRGLALEAVVIGGASLALLGVISRPTRDCDILHPELSEQILDAATEFAAQRRRRGESLASDWFNNGPISLSQSLPDGWLERVQVVFDGKALKLQALGRMDILRTKLFALCDRGTDLPDCVALGPTPRELNEVSGWLGLQDANPEWPAHVRQTLADLSKRLGDGV